MNSDFQVALITGATRGIGYETARLLLARGLRVFINGRDANRCREAARALDPQGEQALPMAFDVADAAAVERACAELSGGIDLLINNAGIFPDAATSALEVDESLVRRALDVNFLGAWRLARLLLPGMQSRGFGRVIHLSSGYASPNKPGARLLAYRSSKAAVSLLTTTLQAEVDDAADLRICAVDPGWVRTDMGGEQAPRSAEEAAVDVVWAACDGNAVGGRLYRYQKAVDW